MLKLDFKGIIAAALIGALAIWAVKRTLFNAVDYVAENSDKFNPTKEENLINQGFTSIYQDVFGSDQSLGADIYDWIHLKEDK